MARKPRTRRPKTYAEQIESFSIAVPRLLDRVVALLGSADFKSPSWGRDVNAAAMTHHALVHVLLSVTPPSEHRERHVALTRTMRRAGDALETLAGLVVSDDADFDLEASQRVLGELSRAHVGAGVTLAGLRRALEPEPDPDAPALVA